MTLCLRSRWLAVQAVITVLALPQFATAAVDRVITFGATADGRPLSHGEAISGTEWLSLGVRFVGQGLHIVNDATCPSCLVGENIAATFVHDGAPAVTTELFINYVASPGAFTIVADIDDHVLFEGAGDLASDVVTGSNIVFALMRTVGNGVQSFGFDAPGPPTILPPGSSQENPVLPSDGSLSAAGFYTFLNTLLAQWVDPPFASGYEYEMQSDSNFTAILDFPTGFASQFTVSVGGTPLPGSFGPGDSVVFPPGTRVFRITGINPLVDADRPDAFPIRLVFDTARADFTMRPLIEPSPPGERVLTFLESARVWLGLKNSDDQGTRFDVRTEVYKNSVLVTSGLARCVVGVTRNPSSALEVVIPIGAFSPVTFASGDVMSLKVLTRIGTNPDDTKCPGHSNATGLRLYYDGLERQSLFSGQLSPNPAGDFFLHTVSAIDHFDDEPPTNVVPLFTDSTAIKFSGGNLWKLVGAWSATIP